MLNCLPSESSFVHDFSNTGLFSNFTDSYEISLLTRKFEDEFVAKEIWINKLEEEKLYLKEQIRETMVEKDDLRKGLKQIQKEKKVQLLMVNPP